MKIAFGAVSFKVDRFAEGEKFTDYNGITEMTIAKITDEFCHIKFSDDLSNFTHKYRMPYRILPEKHEQLQLF